MSFKTIEKLRNSIYIIIPMGCILFWAFIALYKDGFTLVPAADFYVLYYATQHIFGGPEKLYVKKYYHQLEHYTYMPFFAILFWPMGLLTIEQGHWYYYISLILLAELMIILFNQILILKKVRNKFHRFLFLFAITNGIIYVHTFDVLTGSMLPSFAFVWLLKREIQYRELNKDTKTTKFIFTQMMILMLAIGVLMQYIFLAFLYLFHNISLKELFNKDQIKKYLLLIASFFIQNFMLIVIFLISPQSILNLFSGSWRGDRPLYRSQTTLTYDYILKNRLRDPVDGITIMIYVLSIYYNLSVINLNILYFSLILMSVITFIIHNLKDITVERKFGLWALLSLFFFTFSQYRYFLLVNPLIAILFVDYSFKSDKNLIEFVKKNYLLLIGLSCIMILYFMPPIHYLIRVFPFLYQMPLALLYLRYVILYLIIVLTLLLLNKRSKNDFVNINTIEE